MIKVVQNPSDSETWDEEKSYAESPSKNDPAVVAECARVSVQIQVVHTPNPIGISQGSQMYKVITGNAALFQYILLIHRHVKLYIKQTYKPYTLVGPTVTRPPSCNMPR